MSYSIVFTPEANDDLTDILGWFNTKSSAETKKRYIIDVSKTLKILEKSPKSYSIRFKKDALCNFKKFSL